MRIACVRGLCSLWSAVRVAVALVRVTVSDQCEHLKVITSSSKIESNTPRRHSDCDSPPRLRGSREGWANHFTPFDQGISVSPTLRIIYKSNYTAEELLDYFHIHRHLMRPHAQFTWSRPITRPNGVRTTSSSPTARPAAAFQHVLRPMEAAAARRKRLVPEA